MNCPHCGKIIDGAERMAEIGRLGRGVPKTASPEMAAQRKAAAAKSVAARKAKKERGNESL